MLASVLEEDFVLQRFAFADSLVEHQTWLSPPDLPGSWLSLAWIHEAKKKTTDVLHFLILQFCYVITASFVLAPVTQTHAFAASPRWVRACL